MKIGVVGNGFVGSAVIFGFSPQTGCEGASVKIYDKDKSRSMHTLDEVVNTSDFIFVSVPTPSNKDGSINLDVVYHVFDEMDQLNHRSDNIFLLRSTVVPGATRKLSALYPKLNIVFNPEFLTERAAKYDFTNQSRFILGGDPTHTSQVETLLKNRFGQTLPVLKTDYETAELIKYMNNCFLATKVSFLNEMFQIATECGVDWEMAIQGFLRDGRVGPSHLQVPGPDGKLGFGGSCFPKDMQAMIHFSEQLNIKANVLKGVWQTNLQVRPEQDWKQLKNRAVIDD